MLVYMRKAGIDIKGATSCLDDMQFHGFKSAKMINLVQITVRFIMTRLSILVVFIGLVGCTSAPTKITGPDGTENLLISCGVIEACYKEATEVCGRYKIVNTNSETSGTDGSTSTTVKLLVKCDEGNVPKSTQSNNP